MAANPPRAAFLAVLVVVSTVAGVAALGTVATPVAADEHTFETADDYTDEANFTVQFPFTTDHYPGGQNAGNGSIQYWAVGQQAMREIGAEDGAFIDTVVINADWIDYSACGTDNTAAFGIDRGNDNRGTRIDEDLVSRMKDPNFRDDGLTITFYDWSDLGGDPPYAAADDAIVAEQGARSSAGACLTVTDEPGWYQLQGFINGTAADNGPDSQPSEDAKHAGIYAESNYMYVCECDNEQEAREKLGPPPNEEGSSDGGSEETATPTPTPEPADDTDQDTPTPTPEPATDTPTPEPATDTPTPEPAASDGGGSDGNSAGSGGSGGGQATPTPGAGPGFGPVIAVLALLASALLVNRRR
jgi:PGF-CTERM protein